MKKPLKSPFLAAALFPLILSPGCSDESAPTTTPIAPTPASTPSDPVGSENKTDGGGGTPAHSASITEIAGLKWAIPAAWESVAASGMRLAEYKVTGANADAGSASIRFFSTQGSAQMNIDRWKGQVRDPTAGPTEKIIEAGALKSFIVAITGTYSGMGPSGAQTPGKPNSRLLAAFVEGGPRPVQILVSGPDELVRAVEPAWEAMLATVSAE